MKKKLIALLLAAAALSGTFALTACDGGEGEGTDPEQTEAETTAPAEELILAENKKSKFTIIIPDGVTADVYNAAKNAADAIESIGGAKIQLKRFSQVEADEKKYEILVGETGRPESEAASAALTAGSYSITQSGRKIVIVGSTETYLVRALSYFAKNTVAKNKEKQDDGTYKLKFVEFRYSEELPLASFTIGGADLSTFTIVYAAGSDGYSRPAELLRDSIESRYGKTLPVKSDKALKETPNEILLGPTNRAASSAFSAAHPHGLLEYTMGPSGTKFVVNALPYSCVQAVAAFSARYLYGKEKNVALTDADLVSENLRTTLEAPRPAGTDLRVMTANILAEFHSWGYSTPVPERAEIFAAVLETWAPDVIGTQEVTDQWYVYLPRLVGEKYAFLHQMTPDNLVNYSSILYDKTKYDVVDSGVRYFSTEGVNHIRLVTWAVFSPKAGGEKFILFNTHWCWDTEAHAHQQAYEESQLIKEVTKKYPYPYFCTADYNTKQETANYNYFLELTDAVDAKYAARDAGVLLNVAGGCAEFGAPRPESGNSIDHIFMTAGLQPLAFATVVSNCIQDISDHSPKYLDVKLK